MSQNSDICLILFYLYYVEEAKKYKIQKTLKGYPFLALEFKLEAIQ